jgi:acetate kinase
VVHGGAEFAAPIRITPETLARLEALTPLAPLHQPASLGPIRALLGLQPGLPQIACFDTAFHHTLPDTATRLPLPASYGAKGVRRHGFHGLSYEYIASCLACRPGWRRGGRSWRIWAMVPACAPWRRGAASRPRWGFRFSMGW